MATVTKLKKGTPVKCLLTGDLGKINHYNPQTGEIDLKVGKTIISTHISNCKAL